MNSIFSAWLGVDLVQRYLIACALCAFLIVCAWAVVGDRNGRFTQLDNWSHDNEKRVHP